MTAYKCNFFLLENRQFKAIFIHYLKSYVTHTLFIDFDYLGNFGYIWPCKVS